MGLEVRITGMPNVGSPNVALGYVVKVLGIHNDGVGEKS